MIGLLLLLTLAACSGSENTESKINDDPPGLPANDDDAPPLSNDDDIAPPPPATNDDDDGLPPIVNDDDVAPPLCPAPRVLAPNGACVDPCLMMVCAYGCRDGVCLAAPDCEQTATCRSAPTVTVLEMAGTLYTGETLTVVVEVRDPDADATRLELGDVTDGDIRTLPLDPVEVQTRAVEFAYDEWGETIGEHAFQFVAWDATGLASTLFERRFDLLRPPSPFSVGNQFIPDDFGSSTRFRFSVTDLTRGDWIDLNLHFAFWHGEDELIEKRQVPLLLWNYQLGEDATIWLEEVLPFGFGEVDALEWWFAAELEQGQTTEFEHTVWRFR